MEAKKKTFCGGFYFYFFFKLIPPSIEDEKELSMGGALTALSGFYSPRSQGHGHVEHALHMRTHFLRLPSAT